MKHQQQFFEGIKFDVFKYALRFKRVARPHKHRIVSFEHFADAPKPEQTLPLPAGLLNELLNVGRRLVEEVF